MKYSDSPARWTRFGAVAAAALALTLAGCGGTPSPTSPVAQSTPPASAGATDAAASPTVPSTGSASAAATPVAGKKAVLTVTGAKDAALIKAMVITDTGASADERMTQRPLPFSQEVVLPAGFVKIVIVAKYPDGATGELACDISIDGASVSAASTTTHRPAECLWINK